MLKIGRNEPCLCGSGKKYKKCCLEKASLIDNLLNEAERWLDSQEGAEAEDGCLLEQDLLKKFSVNGIRWYEKTTKNPTDGATAAGTTKDNGEDFIDFDFGENFDGVVDRLRIEFH